MLSMLRFSGANMKRDGMIFAFPLLWVAATAAAYFYARDRDIPWALATLVLPAFLVEVSLYFTLGVERFRKRVERYEKASLAALLAAAAVIPYLLAAVALGSFQWKSLAAVAALALTASFWYVVLPARPLTDLLFLAFMALPMLLRVFSQIYAEPHPRLPLAIVGQMMWIRTGLFAMVSLRKGSAIGFGFWPALREWKIGALYYILLLPVAGILASAIQFAEPHMRYQGWGRTAVFALATFFGILWVVALGEEFFFRGLLQQWMSAWLRNEWAALLFTALLFGAVHLWFRAFPNWRFAALAAVAGVFYGLAFRHAKSIRASMVTHALTVTTWRVFFS